MICENKKNIQDVINQATKLRTSADTYFLLIKKRASKSDTFEADMTELKSRIDSVVSQFMKEKGYMWFKILI